ncbi:MAG: peptide deformylase [Actinomycetia bacterium]|nr:peptide deformylase [Actinomycetes bacterium]
MASPHTIRIAGDPVLRRRAEEVDDITADLVDLARRMFDTMYAAPGIGLAAPQVGVEQRFFVYDLGDDDGARVLLNPEITGGDGEWEFAEGCLSIPGQHFEVVRPKQIGVRGVDLDGNPVEFEADELLARLIQHELDHLDGVLVLDHLDDDQRRDAKRLLREYQMGLRGPEPEPEPNKPLFRFGK